MKLARFFLAALILLALFQGLVDRDSAHSGYRYFLPIIERVIPPARLGPFLGSVLALAADPLTPGVVYAGTWGSGVFKSIDSGASWAPVSGGLSNGLIQAIAVDYHTPNTVYAGTYYDAAVYSGVYKSSNGGKTWQPTGHLASSYNGQPVDRPVVYALAADPRQAGTLYAGTRMKELVPGQPDILGGGGIFKTSSAGSSWQTANDGLPPDDLYVYDISVDPNTSGRVYAALHVSGAYGSEDGGAGWTQLGQPNPPDSSGRAIRVDPLNSSWLYYGVWHGMGLYASSTAGTYWDVLGLVDTHISSIAIDPQNSQYLYVSATGLGASTNTLYRSSNHGSNWAAVGTGKFTQLAVDPADGRVYAGSGDGVMVSQDHGASWALSNKGLSGFSVSGVTGSPGVLYAGLYNYGVMKSLNGGASWAPASAGLPAEATVQDLAADPAHPNLLYLVTATSGFYVSHDSAASWTPMTVGLPAALQAGSAAQPAPLQMRPIPPLAQRDEDLPAGETLTAASPAGLAVAVSPLNSALVLAGTAGSGVLRLSGSGWVSTGLSSGSVYGFAFSADGRAFAALDAGAGSLRVSADGGKTWPASAVGLSGRAVYAVSQSPVDGAVFYAGTDNGLYRSLNGGASWTLAGLSGQAVTALSAHQTQAGLILAGTPFSVYLSRDGGASWSEIDPTLEYFGAQAMVTIPGDLESYYLATRYGGLVRIFK